MKIGQCKKCRQAKEWGRSCPRCSKPVTPTRIVRVEKTKEKRVQIQPYINKSAFTTEAEIQQTIKEAKVRWQWLKTTSTD